MRNFVDYIAEKRLDTAIGMTETVHKAGVISKENLNFYSLCLQLILSLFVDGIEKNRGQDNGCTNIKSTCHLFFALKENEC